MAGILTKKKLEDADIDVGHAGEAVNTKKVINPRYGAPFKSIPLVVEEGETKITQAAQTITNATASIVSQKNQASQVISQAESDVATAAADVHQRGNQEIANLQNAIDIAAAAGAGANGWTAQLIVDESGKTQQQVNDASNNVYTKLFGLTSSEVLDQTEIVQMAANVAKLMRKNLVINALVSPAIVRLQELDITGINVYVQKDILIKGVTKGVTDQDAIFKAIGSQESYAEKSSLDGANYDAEDISRNLFIAKYVKQPELSNVKTANLDILVSRTGFFQFCDKPKAVDCQTSGGITGVLFYGCKEPKAIRVTADYCGRDGIAFYTEKGEDLTSDALAQDCKVTRFAVVPDSNNGRGGIHFYGVRRGTALNCTVEDDSFSVHGFGNAGIRFRDCEDFYTDSYDVKNCGNGVLVNEIGDFSSEYGIITKGNIGSGSVSDIRSIGVGVVATRPIECNIVGAKVDGVSDSGSAAGIYHDGVGSIVGCTVKNIPNTSGLTASGIINVTGNVSINCGNGALSIPHFRLANGASASSNTFKDDRNTPVSTLAIRASFGKITIGQNNYSDGISTTLQMNTGSMLSRDSATYRSGFVAINLGGDIENGCTAINSQNIQFIYNNGWKRVSLKRITPTIGTSQTIIPHGLGYKPSVVTLLPKGNFVAWQSADADEANIYLTASADLSQVEVGCQ